jgi:hypothetical protein
VQEVTDPRGIVSRTLYNSLNQTTATISNYTVKREKDRHNP